MDDENMTLEQDLLEQIRATSEAVVGENAGSEGRLTEAKIYDMQVKAINDHYRVLNEEQFNREKLGLERYKIDEELRLRREIEQAKLKIDESKAKAEKWTLWTKTGIDIVALGGYIGMGILYLKANMKYGGMVGRDAKGWFDDLKRIKL